MSNPKYKWIGMRPDRPDGADKVTGRARFGADFSLPGQLVGKVLRSPHAHARITRLDVGAARQAEGVVRVLTGADVAAMCKPYVGVLQHIKGMQSAPQLPLAVDVARWQGEPVAMVVAQTRALAEDAFIQRHGVRMHGLRQRAENVLSDLQVVSAQAARNGLYLSDRAVRDVESCCLFLPVLRCV